MASDILKGQWKQLRGRVKAAWGQLTDDELDEIDGEREVLIGKIQSRYGYNRMKAEQEVDRFMNDLDRSM